MTAAGATLALLPVEAIHPNPANRPEAAIAQAAVQAMTGPGNGAPAGRAPDWAMAGGEGWDPPGRLELAGNTR